MRLLPTALSLFACAGLVTASMPHEDAPSPVSAVDTADAGQPMHWRISWTQDPARQATISWSTTSETEANRVRLVGEDGVERTVAATASGQYTRSKSDAEEVPDGWYHHARVDGLEPGTRYDFVLESGGTESRPLWFRTAPLGDEPFALLYGGDSRSGLEDRQRMNRLVATELEAHPEVLAFVHGGDYVYSGTRWAQWRDWLAHHELCTTTDGRVLPVVPTRGNHDGGPLYDEVWDTPGEAGRNWYGIQLPLGLELLTLNTNVSHAGDQLKWLRAELKQRRPRARWLLCQYHRPAFPAVKAAGAAREAWVPWFEQHDVDLVFESDGHAVKRTAPIRDESIDETGVVYLGEGGLGVAQRTPHTRRWYLQEPGMSGRGHHLTLLEVSAETLRARTFGYPVDEDTGRIADGAKVVDFDDFTRPQREQYPVVEDGAASDE
ncbi:MAG: metallophosphoesterase family protein [Planctomycetota bacterium]|nr:metallophosphoesterase family protein [Planctomycetota bacterium]